MSTSLQKNLPHFPLANSTGWSIWQPFRSLLSGWDHIRQNAGGYNARGCDETAELLGQIIEIRLPQYDQDAWQFGGSHGGGIPEPAKAPK